MRKLSRLAVRIALIGAATCGAVAACYDRVPGPSGPLPPTKEAKPFGGKPKRVKPIELDPKPTIELSSKFSPHAPTPAHDVPDAGLADTLELPPIPDASVPLDPPGVKK